MATSSPSQSKATRGKTTTKTNGTATRAAAEEPMKASPSADDIARRAYEIYEREGRQPGTELQNWLKAEAELGVGERH